MEQTPLENSLEFTLSLWYKRLSLIFLLWFLALFGAIAFFIRPSQDLIILRYNVFFGVDILGVWWQAYLVPVMSFIIVLGNMLLSFLLKRRGNALPALLLLFGSGLLMLAATVATGAAIFINT